MKIKPLELANLCTLFHSLRTEILSDKELLKYVRKTMLIDSNSTPHEIVSHAINYNLIEKENFTYRITTSGKILGKYQDKPDFLLKEKSKKILIKECFLNLRLFDFNCKNLIMLFEPNSFFETFVYKRTYKESVEIVNWIKVLDGVNLIYTENKHVFVRKEHLSIVNEFIRGIRNHIVDFNDQVIDNERNKIGDLAEEIAVDYEVNRLKKNGYVELTKLVQRISKIDTSAGFDIISCQGTGKYPEKRRLIEVKGTQSDKIQFIWSKNERNIATREGKSYWLYCFTNINIAKREASGPTCINDPIIQLSRLNYKVEPIDLLYIES